MRPCASVLPPERRREVEVARGGRDRAVGDGVGEAYRAARCHRERARRLGRERDRQEGEDAGGDEVCPTRIQWARAGGLERRADEEVAAAVAVGVGHARDGPTEGAPALLIRGGEGCICAVAAGARRARRSVTTGRMRAGVRLIGMVPLQRGERRQTLRPRPASAKRRPPSVTISPSSTTPPARPPPPTFPACSAASSPSASGQPSSAVAGRASRTSSACSSRRPAGRRG